MWLIIMDIFKLKQIYKIGKKSTQATLLWIITYVKKMLNQCKQRGKYITSEEAYYQ